MYSSPTRLRMEREAGRRGNAAVVVSTLLSLAVVVAAVAVVAYLVLREPASSVDSAERLDPVGTAISAPTEAPNLPTPIPTQEPAQEPAAPGFSGDQPEISALPTVDAAPDTAAAAPEATGPTPTPRLVALPTEPPTAVPTLPAPVATLPPPPSEVPVVALAPVEVAPPPAPTVTARAVTTEPTPQAADARGADPLGIFAEDNLPRIVPAGNSDAVNQVRDMQDEVRGRKSDREEESPDQAPAVVVPTIAARPDTGPITRKEDGSVEVVMPDVEATIEAITARTTDPNRNPNVARDDGADAGKKDDNGRKQPTPTAGSKKKNDRNRGRQTPTPRPGIVPATENRDNNNNGSNQGNDKQCDNPFANLPKDQQPKNWPFDDC
ncbi:MAG: hypothetical protein U0031_00575 [Thermomicrobiales bacterium]